MLPVAAAKATPSVVAKNIIQMSEFEKPKTRDCHALKTFEQLKTAFISQVRPTLGCSALLMRSMVCIRDDMRPTAELPAIIHQRLCCFIFIP